MAYKIVDLRKKLPGSPVASQGAKVKNRGVVIHYNGDPDGTTGVVSGGKTPEQVYIADAHYHINKNWNTAADPAYTNGIQYHFGIWGDTVYILRNPDACLWHCGDWKSEDYAWKYSYNYNATAINVPISSRENANARTLQTLKEFCDDEMRKQKKTKRECVGHQEVSSTECPGNLMANFVKPYRAGSLEVSDPKPEPVTLNPDAFPRWTFVAMGKLDLIAASAAEMALNAVEVVNGGVLTIDPLIKAVTKTSMNAKRHTENHPGVPFTVVVGKPAADASDESAKLSIEKNLGPEITDVVSAVGTDYNDTLKRLRGRLSYLASLHDIDPKALDFAFINCFKLLDPELSKEYAPGLGEVKLPDPKPVTKVRAKDEIRGSARISKDKVMVFAKSKGAKQPAIDLINHIYVYAPQRNIGADFLSVQMLLETGWGNYTGDSKPYNPAGIKKAGQQADVPLAFEVPSTPNEGARMLINHWCAVLGLDPIGFPHGRYEEAKKVYASRPKITKISQLGGGNWAMDPNYGNKIMNILNEAETGDTVKPPAKTPDQNINYSKWAAPTAATVRDIATKFKIFADTYPGHGTTGQAYGIDFWVAPLGLKANKRQEEIGDAIQQYIEKNWNRLRISYIIWWGWYSESPGDWVRYNPSWYNNPNASKDPDTVMHMDHLHVQVY